LIDRRTFLAGTGAVLLTTPLAAEAQQAGKVARVGYPLFGPRLSPEEIASGAATNPLWLRMKELGWVEGQNMVVERRWGESLEQRRAAVAALVRLPVDLLVVGSLLWAKLAQGETKTIPLVAIVGGDLVANGLVTNLARPDGNLTGLQVLAEDLVPKQIELLKVLVPNLARIASLGVPEMGDRYAQQAAVGARALRLELHPFIVRQPGDIATAFREMIKNGDQGLVVFPSPSASLHRKDIIDLAAKHRIATIYPNHYSVQAGGLMSYGVNYPTVDRRAAEYVDKILRGAKPGDLPIEQPTKFELVISLKTAKALGLTIPPSLLGRADEIIQ
jgi:putative ABC transport system substrate-binding protein